MNRSRWMSKPQASSARRGEGCSLPGTKLAVLVLLALLFLLVFLAGLVR